MLKSVFVIILVMYSFEVFSAHSLFLYKHGNIELKCASHAEDFDLASAICWRGPETKATATTTTTTNFQTFLHSFFNTACPGYLHICYLRF